MLSVADQAARGMFASPVTGKPLRLRGGELATDDGTEKFRVVGDRAFFLSSPEADRNEGMASSYVAHESARERFRRLLRSTILAPVRSRQSVAAFARFRELTAGGFVLAVGGGGPVRDFDAVNLNIGPWPNVEIVADAHALPYRTGSVDHICCLAVLEHLPRPDVAVAEMARVLKPGGHVLLETRIRVYTARPGCQQPQECLRPVRRLVLLRGEARGMGRPLRDSSELLPVAEGRTVHSADDAFQSLSLAARYRLIRVDAARADPSLPDLAIRRHSDHRRLRTLARGQEGSRRVFRAVGERSFLHRIDYTGRLLVKPHSTS